MKTKVNGIEVVNLTKARVRNNLPRFVREAAEDRGYGDATQPLSLYIHEGDIGEAFHCAAQGDGSMCVMAQAGKRIGAKAVYFYRTKAWVDFGAGPIVRFQTSRAIYNNVIEPFDRGEREEVRPGIYHLTPPTKSRQLSRERARTRKYPRTAGKNLDGSRSSVAHAHTERVVMASRASG
jgi:hypothetical protein